MDTTTDERKWDSSKDNGEFDDSHIENTAGSASPSDNGGALAQWPTEEQDKIMRSVDIRLIPIAGFMYCVSLLDRTNLSNASIAGMTTELQLTAPGVDRYSLVTLIFFITYTIFQPAATVLCRKIGPRVFLSTITLLWGALMIGFGFVQNWQTLLGLRALLGILEAGFFPGIVYLMSTWYTRYEVGKRYAYFYVIGILAAAFGGILAFGLMQMEGVAGFGGWRWIFIMEGVLTCVVAGFGFWLLLSFPDNQKSRSLKFLTEDERRCVIARVQHDRGDAELLKFNFKLWAGSSSDWKIWAYAMIFLCITTVAYALAYFLPQILNLGMGFSRGQSQCLVAPPYVAAGILMLVCGWLGDKYHVRGPILCFNAILAMAGLAMMGYAKNNGARYFGVHLAASGANASVPVVMAYQANNIRGQWKRAFCSATLVGFGAIGGIIGSTVFRSQDSPGYVPGLSTAMGLQVVVCVLVGILSWEFRRQNAMADRGEKVLEGGDADFRYTL